MSEMGLELFSLDFSTKRRVVSGVVSNTPAGGRGFLDFYSG